MSKNEYRVYWDWVRLVSALKAESEQINQLLTELQAKNWPINGEGVVTDKAAKEIARKILAVENRCEKLASMARECCYLSVFVRNQNKAYRAVKQNIIENFKVEIDDSNFGQRIIRIPCLLPKRNSKDSYFFHHSLDVALSELLYEKLVNGPFKVEIKSVYPTNYPYEIRLLTTPEIAETIERLKLKRVFECIDETDYKLELSAMREDCERPYTLIIITRQP